MKKVMFIYGITLALVAGVFYACNKIKDDKIEPNKVNVVKSENSSMSSDMTSEQEQKVLENLRIIELGLIDLSKDVR